ncbi:sensor domain-containing diguanylate cyclase [Halomonas saccharevitans]|uniref:Diguanylate cyclase (GGDEF) domain-containing protein n=1 Tax=Halomonas saccharevitans TaxID=416872 RepID=A0A1I7AP73_9GAMM|nr:diguanylate cyclase [Halomonas saccharevitans]SFT76593.1 diguanylate cyclase (GGDEF) domain-containing protein [Halomonas saccharevitans]
MNVATPEVRLPCASQALAALARESRALMQDANWADGVDRLLAEIGRSTGASRVWIFQLLELREEAVVQDYVFEWAAAPRYRQLMQRRFRFFHSALGDPVYRRMIEERRAGQAHDLCVPRMDESPLRRHLESQHIRSMATVPIVVHGEWWGTLGIDDCERAISWQGPGLDLLTTASELIAAALYRHQLTSRSRQLELFHQVTNCGVWEVVLSNGRVWCSQALKALLDYPATYPRVPLRRLLARVQRQDRQRLWAELRRALSQRQAMCRLDVRLALGDADEHWFDLLAEIRRDEAGRPQIIAGILIDIRQRKRDEQDAWRAAESDTLTGALNRRGLARWLEARAEARRLHLLMLDIDHFKRVNDAHGHPAGDALLRLLARRLRDALREEDALVRLGGEEFAVVVRGRDDASAVALAERLRRIVVATPFRLGLPGHGEGLSLAVSISLGVALLPGASDAAERRLSLAMAWADEALYAAKQAGRDRVRIHESVCEQADDHHRANEIEGDCAG